MGPRLHKRKSIVLPSAILAGIAAVLAVGISWGRAKLASGVEIGSGRLQVFGPSLGWGLSFAADSFAYRTDGFSAEGDRLRGDFDVFRPVPRLRPSVSARLDSLTLRITEARPPSGAGPAGLPDSVAAPALRIPLAVRAWIDHIVVRRDTSVVARFADAQARAREPGLIDLHVGSIALPALEPIRPSLSAEVRPAGRDSLRFSIALRRVPDSLRIAGRVLGRDLLKGRLRVQGSVASTRPYLAALGVADTLPSADSIAVEARARFGGAYSLRGGLSARLSGFGNGPLGRLDTQRVRLDLSFDERRRDWALRSRGAGGARIALAGSILVPDSAAGLADFVQTSALTAHGTIRDLPVTAAGRPLGLDLRLYPSYLGRDSLRFRAATGESSRVAAALAKREGAWSGPFHAEISQGEAALAAFLDTSVSYSRLVLDGNLRDGGADIRTRFYDARAYGVSADSLVASQSYGPGGYRLDSARLYRNGVMWRLSGRVDTGGFPLSFTASNPRFGTLEYSMPRRGVIEARARGLHPLRLPYDRIQDIGIRRPVVTGSLRWNLAAGTGRLDLDAWGAYGGRSARFSTRAQWTPDSLFLPIAAETRGGSAMRAEARIAVDGNPFAAWSRIGPSDAGFLSLEADDFDLAEALGIFLERPPVASGRLEGDLTYRAGRGFGGEYRVRNLSLRSGPGGLRITGVTVEGHGDSLVVRAATQSERPWLRNSLRIAITDLQSPSRRVRARIVSAGSLVARFEGMLHGGDSLTGTLRAEGSLSLPGEAGRVRGVGLRGEVSLPFERPLRGLSFASDSLHLVYAVPGLDTETVSGRLVVGGGLAEIRSLEISDAAGRVMRGEASYRFAGEDLLRAELSGGDLAFRLPGGGDAHIWRADLFLSRDSGMTVARLEFDSGTVSRESGALRLRAGLRNARFSYRAPRGGEGAGPRLQGEATLADSRLAYKVRSLEAVEDLFGRAGFAGGGSEDGGTAGTEPRPAPPLELELDLRAMGDANRIETDLLRASLVGHVHVTGTAAQPRLTGRVRALEGELGFQGQAFAVREFEVVWPGAPPARGEVDMRAVKRLAADCEPEMQDSCEVALILLGELSDFAFSYESDCGGAAGGAVNLAALINSVRLGCYAPEFFAGGSAAGGGAGLAGEAALGLLEPVLSRNISRIASRLSGRWISRAEISGLAAFAEGSQTEEVSLRLTSREIERLRLIGRAAYHPWAPDLYTPWEYMLALAWRPPFGRVIGDEDLANLLADDVSLRLTLQTEPTSRFSAQEEDIRKRIEADYDHGFWRWWWEN